MDERRFEKIKRWLFVKYILALGLGVGAFFALKYYCNYTLHYHEFTSICVGMFGGGLIICIGCGNTTKTANKAAEWRKETGYKMGEK